MATHFPYSTRAMEAATQQRALIGLFMAIVLVSAWSLWFVLGSIPLYESSNPVEIVPDEVVVATFPPSVRQHIRRGGEVQVRLDSPSDIQVVPAVISTIEPGFEDDPIEVQVLVKWDDVALAQPRSPVPGRVEVATRSVSPLTLFVQALENSRSSLGY